MRSILMLTIYFITCAFGKCYTDSLGDFLQRYPQTYQDIFFQREIVQLGTDVCEPRLELIKPIFELYNRPFTVLEIGAAQGYFSFNIADRYPHATCVMIEDNTVYYPEHGDELYSLCRLNDYLKNIFYLRKRIVLSDLQYLNSNEHFDVVLAFLVIHQIDDSLEQKKLIIENLLTLGDNVIIEVANNVDVPLTEWVQLLSEQVDCEYLGELKRLKDVNKSYCTGIFYWFKNNKSKGSFNDMGSSAGIKSSTFRKMNGVYP